MFENSCKDNLSLFNWMDIPNVVVLTEENTQNMNGRYVLIRRDMFFYFLMVLFSSVKYLCFWVCSNDNILSPIFSRICIVWRMLHHGLVGQVQSKECSFMFTYTFLTFFCCPSSKILRFYLFSPFDEVSSFCSRILINQKPELVIRNC